MFDLSGRVALVTGATGGLGEAIAHAFAACGARLAISGTREDKLEALKLALGSETVAIPADLSDRSAVDGIVPAVEDACGKLDILVNNAGFARDALVMRMKDVDWDTVIEVDLSAGFRLARSALKGMMRRRHGRIIGVSSIVGLVGSPGQANYAAAKAGMIGWSKSLAREVAQRGITVNVIAPGYIDTAMTRKLDPQILDRFIAQVPIARAGAVEDVAAAAVYLASREASYVTGHTLHVNGGMLMN